MRLLALSRIDRRFYCKNLAASNIVLFSLRTGPIVLFYFFMNELCVLCYRNSHHRSFLFLNNGEWRKRGSSDKITITMTLDIKLLYFFNNFAGKSQVFDALIVFLAAYLQYFLVAVFLVLLYFAAYSKREKLYLFWTTALSIAVARGVITEIIRFLYNRPRPFLTLSVSKLLSNGWFYSDTEWSFPSGHSAFFFAMATAIYFYHKKWGVWFFIAAILMNISRIVAGVHYPSDILGGAIIGIIAAYVIFYFAEKRNLKKNYYGAP